MQNDILKEYVARGTYIYPPAPSLRLVTDVFSYCAEKVPRWNTISISGYHIREAGATAPQEIAYTFAHALEYVRAARAAGLDAGAFGERISFFFACHSDFIEEVAKFRAARRLWARLVKETLGVDNPRAQHLRFHVQTGGVTLTAQQPDNNVVRVALQALAAVLGGCQSLHTNGKDEALALPTESSARLALRTQQVIAHETGVADTVDPLGGSYAVEAATDLLEAEARRILDRIETRGGALAAIERGEIQREIQESAYRHQRRGRVRRARDRGREHAGGGRRGAALRDPAHRPRPGARAGRACPRPARPPRRRRLVGIPRRAGGPRAVRRQRHAHA